MKAIYLMCGLPGSGKSTVAIRLKDTRDIIISRDKIRFSLFKDDKEDYFAHEKEVFNIFIKEINEALSMHSIDDIYIDATHLNEKSRNKVLDKLNLTENTWIYIISCEASVNTCIERQKYRTGKTVVPASTIRRMSAVYEIPTMNEKHEYACIFHVNALGNIERIEK